VLAFFHSIAFGSLQPFIDDSNPISSRQLEMTTGIMAHSLVSWTQALTARSMLVEGSRVLAMTSTGSFEVWSSYGAVSAAKAALEAHVRQLAFELAQSTPWRWCYPTPALHRIPTWEGIRDVALRKNPSKRLTLPSDVAEAVVALCHPGTAWITGNVINVDGGEAIAG
jgi:enoyl-[acyl-carrier-protein] reductase (NADH)